MKPKTFQYEPALPQGPEAMREASPLAVGPMQINVRAAKDRLSSLLEEAARGREIVITSDGKPKAKLVPVQPQRKRFRVDWELLKRTPGKAAPSAEELIRAERDGRP